MRFENILDSYTKGGKVTLNLPHPLFEPRWVVETCREAKRITCPLCKGARYLTVTIPNEPDFTLECEYCKGGWSGPMGYEESYPEKAYVAERTFERIEVNACGAIKYSAEGCAYTPEQVYASKEEAERAAAKENLRIQALEEEHRTGRLGYHKGQVSSSLSYYYKRRRELQRNLQWVEKKLHELKQEKKNGTAE